MKDKKSCFLSMSDESFWLKSLKNEQIKNQEVFNDLIINFWKINNSDLIIYLDTKKKILYKNT